MSNISRSVVLEAYSSLDRVPLSNKERTALVSMSWAAMTRKLNMLGVNTQSDYFYRTKLGTSFWLDVADNHINLYYKDILLRSWIVGNSYITCYMEEQEIIDLADSVHWLIDLHAAIASSY